jgi:hypothetical protein
MPLELLAIPAIIFGVIGFISGINAYKKARK